MKLTNNEGISLPLSVWLCHDTYDYSSEDKYISATSILKPSRALLIGDRIKDEDVELDIGSIVKSSMGTAIHDSIERAWFNKEAVAKALKLHEYPKSTIDKLRINPEEHDPKMLNVYMELRTRKEINGYTIGGKFDLILDGQIRDYKSTSTFSYTSGKMDEKYALQGSIYRWLNPEKVTKDTMVIDFIFTDWKQGYVGKQAGYPKSNCISREIPLISIKKIEAIITAKLMSLDDHKANNTLPECSDEELWLDPPVYKYFKNPTSSRATKNFTDYGLASAYMAKAGGIGEIRTVQGEPKACTYCNANSICTQLNKFK